MNWEGDRVSNQRIMLCSTSRVGFQLVGIQPSITRNGFHYADRIKPTDQTRRSKQFLKVYRFTLRSIA